MVTLHALVLLAAAAAPNDAVLLSFSADWCSHCRSMEPTVRRFESNGFQVRHVNVDTDRQTATQLGVKGVPCYVLMVSGREAGRLEGATSYDRLVQLYRIAGTAPPTNPDPVVRGQSPEEKTLALPAFRKLGSMFQGSSGANRGAADTPAPKPSQFAPTSVTLAPSPAGNAIAANSRPASTSAGSTSAAGTSAANATAIQTALRSTVRLRVEDPKGQSIGTGTIIDIHDDEALIVTCGHIFRDSQGKGVISVDLFAPGAGQPAPGCLVGYDLQRDIGLVSVRPGIPVQSARVAPAGFPVTKGQACFSVGCDHGAAPSVQESRIAGINKYLGPPNFEVAGQPVDGRSGGGLFSADGQLIGICNAADKQDNEGLYAALSTIHWQLDEIGQQQIYQRQAPSMVVAGEPSPMDTAGQPGASNIATNSVLPPASRPDMPLTLVDRDMRHGPASLSNAPTGQILNDGAVSADETEVICIVRPRGNSAGKTEVLILDRAPRDLIDRLNREGRPHRGPELDVGIQGRPIDRISNDGARRGLPSGSPVIRGQSVE